MGRKKKRGTHKVREAKEALKEILKDKPEVVNMEWNFPQVYSWLQKEHPELTRTLTLQQVRGVWSMFANPLFRQALLAQKHETESKDTSEKPEENPLEPTSKGTSSGKNVEKELVATEPTSMLEETHIIDGLGGRYPPRDEEITDQISGVIERELWVKATPIVRKIILNPKIWLYYDYARSALGYQGDIGQFLEDCVEDFWRSRGYKIKIIKEEEIS